MLDVQIILMKEYFKQYLAEHMKPEFDTSLVKKVPILLGRQEPFSFELLVPIKIEETGKLLTKDSYLLLFQRAN